MQADARAKLLSQRGGAAGGLVIAGGQVISGGQVITPSAAAEQLSLSEQLAKLADLKDRGVLTEAEFEDQKQKLLGT